MVLSTTPNGNITSPSVMNVKTDQDCAGFESCRNDHSWEGCGVLTTCREQRTLVSGIHLINPETGPEFTTL